MINRHVSVLVQKALSRQAAVALLGPRQVGKTTLAQEIGKTRASRYLDLESREDRAKLADPSQFFQKNANSLIILDEIHRVPDLFQVLRGVIDQGRRKGLRTGRFLILGSASIDLLRQSGESLAGRIEFIHLAPLNVLEAGTQRAFDQDTLWLRGGFPDSYLAADDADSYVYRRNFIRTYLERDLPQFGSRVPATTLERLWTMLAHNQGQVLNASRLAASLGVTAPTVSSYVDLLCDLLLVRRLPPFIANTQKRLVKSPRIFIRDSGIVHALLDIEDYNQLLGHPVAGASWEAFVIENILSGLPDTARPAFYRTAAGAEMDLVLQLPRNKRWAVEVKSGLAPKLGKGFFLAREDLVPERSFVIYFGKDRYPLAEGTEAISLSEFMQEVRNQDAGGIK
jgi:hypothetical protein